MNVFRSMLVTANFLLMTCTAQADVPVYGYEVVKSYPHSTNAFTQGLQIHEGYLYEGTGRLGRSSLSQISLEDGAVLKTKRLPSRYFGEGITIVEDKIYQLTWQTNIAFVYDLETFDTITSHYYPTEGWGLTWDGTHLILSDGTDELQFIDPETFAVLNKIPVRWEGIPVRNLNELEYINGEVWANVWLTNEIVRIDPQSGAVTGIIDLTGLVEQTTTGGPEAVLNGIAWEATDDAGNGRLFVTGKLWGNIFEIILVQKQ
ncbi:MAG: glutaminyl-peptide cyclotransferase [Gammaproteobacteria bacterium]|nr:glutaminyl-peptide cyclotransferase [Gammaproteobacteria bacterium]MDP2141681.1 glutaminyl-peptide cyclotransferase [Gammaproteobacteria bacterium]MDP2347916.1 glutaminyl-peptide cyclotransferase [Gammaproteobacteria bacterium]